MNEESIIIRTDMAFKSAELNKATAGLAECFNSANTSYKEACKILARVEANTSYKEDGFGSLAEYAETIGIKKSKAHKMENAGRLLLSDNEVIRDFAEKADYTKSILLASEDAEEVAAAIEAGDIKPESTASDIRAWKSTRVPKDGKEKVLPTWHFVGHALRSSSFTSENEDGKEETFVEYYAADIDETVGAASPEEWAKEFSSEALVAKVKDSDGVTHYMGLNPDGSMFNFTAERVKKSDKPKAPVAPVAFDLSKLPDEIVQRMIEEYNQKRAQ